MRAVNRVLALLIGIALIGAAAVVIIEVVAQQAGADPVVVDATTAHRWAQRTTWDSAAVRGIAGLLVIVGIALLAAQLLPRRPARLRVRSDDGATDAAITRRGLAHALSDAVNDVDGVSASRVAVRRRRVKIKARSRPGDAAGSSRDSATRAAQSRLDALNLSRPPRVKVTMSTGGR